MRAYERNMNEYKEFAASKSMEYTSATTLADFVVDKATVCSALTLKNKVSAIGSYMSHTTGDQTLKSSRVVKEVIRVIQKTYRKVHEGVARWPLPSKVIVQAMNSLTTDAPIDKLRDVALVATAFLGIMRADTVMSLQVREAGPDISVSAAQLVCINRTRGSVAEKGRGAQRQRHDSRDGAHETQILYHAPKIYVNIMKRWLSKRLEIDEIGNLWNVGRSDEFKGREKLRFPALRLQRALRRVLSPMPENCDAAHYTSHSLRIGAATACYAIGVRKDTIKYVGGWTGKDNSNVNRYIITSAKRTKDDMLLFGSLAK